MQFLQNKICIFQVSFFTSCDASMPVNIGLSVTYVSVLVFNNGGTQLWHKVSHVGHCNQTRQVMPSHTQYGQTLLWLHRAIAALLSN